MFWRNVTSLPPLTVSDFDINDESDRRRHFLHEALKRKTPMPKKKSPDSVRLRNSTAEFLTFAYQSGGDGVEVRMQDGTIWLSQKNMRLLFETTPENVLMHLKNIFAENELPESATANDFLAVQTEGKRLAHAGLLKVVQQRRVLKQLSTGGQP